MAGNNITPKSIKKTADHLVYSNFGRVEAIVFITVFAIMFSLLLRELAFSFLADFIAASETGGMIANALSLLTAAFCYVVFTPLLIGSSKWYYTQIRKSGEEYVGIIFYFYKNNKRFLDSIKFDISRITRLGTYFVLCFAPAGGMIAFLSSVTDGFTRTINNAFALYCAAAMLVIAGLILYIVIALRYFLARYYFVTGNYAKIGDCFIQSSKNMKGNKGLVVSMVWANKFRYIFGLLIIPLVYVIPMHDMCMAGCASAIIGGEDEED